MIKKLTILVSVIILSIIGVYAGTWSESAGVPTYDSNLMCVAGITQTYDLSSSLFQNVKLMNVTALNVTGDSYFTGNLDLGGNNLSNVGQFYMNYSSLLRGNVNRPLFSKQEKNISVCSLGCDYDTIQEAVYQVPYYLSHKYIITVHDGTYNEDLFIPAFTVTNTIDENDGAVFGLTLRGNSSNVSGVKLKSIQITGVKGSQSPTIEYFTMTGYDETSDENASIVIYGSNHVQTKHLDFTGCIAKFGIVIYGSSSTFEDVNFGNNDLEYALYVKHGGVVYSNNNYSTGSVQKYIAKTDSGQIFLNGDGIRIGYNETLGMFENPVDHSGLAISRDTNNDRFILHQVNQLEEADVYFNNIHSDTFYDVSNEDKVASFNFNSESIVDNKVLDSTNNDNYATNNGALFNNDISLLGDSANFDGSDYIDFNDKVNNISAFSVWVYLDASQNATQGDILDGRTGSKDFTLIHRTGNKFAINIGDGAGNQDISAQDTDMYNKWYHLAGFYNGSEWKFYVNGVLEKTITVIGDWNIEVAGVRSTTFANDFLIGNLDELNFWNRDITEQEIKNIYLQRKESINPYLSKKGGEIYGNITLYSPDGTAYNCGVANGGTFSCS